MPNFPSIPVPTEDPKALLETCLTLKQAVEMLTGQDQAQNFAPHVFVQPSTPVAIHTGDLWLCTTSSSSFNVWNGSQWLKIAAITALEADAEQNLMLSQFKQRPG